MNQSSLATNQPFPSLFVSHGAPTFAIEPGVAGQLLSQVAANLPKPRAIIIVSPHWQTAQVKVTSSATLETIHDFGGFPQDLYRLQYPATGSPSLAGQIVGALQAKGLAAQLDDMRGLDHGAWVPLMLMYPNADIPVVQVSMPQSLTQASALALGAALSEFTHQGYFVIGSGSLTHNLYEIQWQAEHAEPYVAEFVQGIRASLQAGKASELHNLLQRTPHGQRAHPTIEHFLPLLVAAGAAGANDRHFETKVLDGGTRQAVVSMESYLFTAH